MSKFRGTSLVTVLSLGLLVACSGEEPSRINFVFERGPAQTMDQAAGPIDIDGFTADVSPSGLIKNRSCYFIHVTGPGLNVPGTINDRQSSSCPAGVPDVPALGQLFGPFPYGPNGISASIQVRSGKNRRFDLVGFINPLPDDPGCTKAFDARPVVGSDGKTNVLIKYDKFVIDAKSSDTVPQGLTIPAQPYGRLAFFYVGNVAELGPGVQNVTLSPLAWKTEGSQSHPQGYGCHDNEGNQSVSSAFFPPMEWGNVIRTGLETPFIRYECPSGVTNPEIVFSCPIPADGDYWKQKTCSTPSPASLTATCVADAASGKSFAKFVGIPFGTGATCYMDNNSNGSWNSGEAQWPCLGVALNQSPAETLQFKMFKGTQYQMMMGFDGTTSVPPNHTSSLESQYSLTAAEASGLTLVSGLNVRFLSPMGADNLSAGYLSPAVRFAGAYSAGTQKFLSVFSEENAQSRYIEIPIVQSSSQSVYAPFNWDAKKPVRHTLITSGSALDSIMIPATGVGSRIFSIDTGTPAWILQDILRPFANLAELGRLDLASPLSGLPVPSVSEEGNYTHLNGTSDRRTSESAMIWKDGTTLNAKLLNGNSVANSSIQWAIDPDYSPYEHSLSGVGPYKHYAVLSRGLSGSAFALFLARCSSSDCSSQPRLISLNLSAFAGLDVGTGSLVKADFVQGSNRTDSLVLVGQSNASPYNAVAQTINLSGANLNSVDPIAPGSIDSSLLSTPDPSKFYPQWQSPRVNFVRSLRGASSTGSQELLAGGTASFGAQRASVLYRSRDGGQNWYLVHKADIYNPTSGQNYGFEVATDAIAIDRSFPGGKSDGFAILVRRYNCTNWGTGSCAGTQTHTSDIVIQDGHGF
jgi:hypothetical protein